MVHTMGALEFLILSLLLVGSQREKDEPKFLQNELVVHTNIYIKCVHTNIYIKCVHTWC
jgi:hypothetical protein